MLKGIIESFSHTHSMSEIQFGLTIPLDDIQFTTTMLCKHIVEPRVKLETGKKWNIRKFIRFSSRRCEYERRLVLAQDRRCGRVAIISKSFKIMIDWVAYQEKKIEIFSWLRLSCSTCQCWLEFGNDSEKITKNKTGRRKLANIENIRQQKRKKSRIFPVMLSSPVELNLFHAFN